MTATGEPPVRAYIGLGGNVGDAARTIDRAVNALAALPATQVVAQSALYRSAPFGPIAQPDFVNGVAAIDTALAARDLLHALQGIEAALGRVRDSLRWGPRTIDLDLLLYGDAVIAEPDLTVPHPGIAERNFVLLPLQEIAPDLEIPGLGLLADIAAADQPRIQRLD